MLLDGQHTGRYRWDQLHKTEKTHFGTLVEINLQRAFGFDDGMTMDFAIPVPGPGSGELVSVRLASRRPHHEGSPFVLLDGRHWVVALPDDPPEAAPVLPGI